MIENKISTLFNPESPKLIGANQKNKIVHLTPSQLINKLYKICEPYVGTCYVFIET